MSKKFSISWQIRKLFIIKFNTQIKSDQLNSDHMNVKQSNSTFCSQESSNNTQIMSLSNKFVQIYKIKVDDIRTSHSKKSSERIIYLNIKFSDQASTLIPTRCVDILNDNKFFEIKSQVNIEKVEVLDYETLKKLSKISLVGIKKEFSHTHIEDRNQIQVFIERKHVELRSFNKTCKQTESIVIDHTIKEKEVSSTDDSSSEVSN